MRKPRNARNVAFDIETQILAGTCAQSQGVHAKHYFWRAFQSTAESLAKASNRA